MRPSKLWRTILENWPIKVFSFLLAVSVFIVINYVTLNTRIAEIPLQVRIPEGYEATSNILESVTLRIQADERYIGMIDPTAIEAIADFSSVSEDGVASVPVLLKADPSYMDVEVAFTTTPDIVRVFFQKTEQSSSVGEQENVGGIDL